MVTGTTQQKQPSEVFDPTTIRSSAKTKSTITSSVAINAPVFGKCPEIVSKVQYKSMSLFVIILLVVLIAIDVILYMKLGQLQEVEMDRVHLPDVAKLRYVFWREFC